MERMAVGIEYGGERSVWARAVTCGSDPLNQNVQGFAGGVDREEMITRIEGDNILDLFVTRTATVRHRYQKDSLPIQLSIPPYM